MYICNTVLKICLLKIYIIAFFNSTLRQHECQAVNKCPLVARAEISPRVKLASCKLDLTALRLNQISENLKNFSKF